MRLRGQGCVEFCMMTRMAKKQFLNSGDVSDSDSIGVKS